ncbi:Ig heavy chain V region, partial [Clarias magur]
MAKVIISGVIIISLNASSISSLNIQQTPEHLFISPEQRKANLSCRHGDTNYNYMYWYQQKAAGDHIQLIGMLQYGAVTPEEKFKSRFNISGHAKADAFLLISSVTPEDSAVYFCAARSLHEICDRRIQELQKKEFLILN